MSLSRHEQSLLAATVLVALFGVLGIKLRPGLEAWRQRLDRLDSLHRERAAARDLIDQGPQWRDHYDEVKDQMPVFAKGVQVDTHWMSIMDQLAAQYDVSITRRQVGRETIVGDVYEFTTDCQWEAPLDSFAEFLCAMQDAGAMLDVRELLIRTHGNRKGFLRGSFTLYCAYMRADPEENATADTEPAPRVEAAGPESSSPAGLGSSGGPTPAPDPAAPAPPEQAATPPPQP